MNESGDPTMNPEEEAVRQVTNRRRIAAIGVGIAAFVILGYAAVILVGGAALKQAPFAERLLELRERVGEAIAPRPPALGLRPIRPPGGEITVSPSPVVARPSPSPSFIPPAPDEPSTVTFTIDFENTTGVRLTGVRVVDRIPSGASYVTGSASPVASFDGSQLVWQIGVLDPGQSGRVSFRVLTRSGTITNRAVLHSNEAPPSEVTSSATVS